MPLGRRCADGATQIVITILDAHVAPDKALGLKQRTDKGLSIMIRALYRRFCCAVPPSRLSGGS